MLVITLLPQADVQQETIPHSVPHGIQQAIAKAKHDKISEFPPGQTLANLVATTELSPR
jgi:hypothetical protein